MTLREGYRWYHSSPTKRCLVQNKGIEIYFHRLECKQKHWRENISSTDSAKGGLGEGGRLLRGWAKLLLLCPIPLEPNFIFHLPQCKACQATSPCSFLSCLNSLFHFPKKPLMRRCKAFDGIISLILLNSLGGQEGCRKGYWVIRCFFGTTQQGSGQCWPRMVLASWLQDCCVVLWATEVSIPTTTKSKNGLKKERERKVQKKKY